MENKLVLLLCLHAFNNSMKTCTKKCTLFFMLYVRLAIPISEWKVQTTEMLLLKNIEFSVFLQGTTTATTTNLTNHNLYEGMFAELDSNLIRMMIIKKYVIYFD